MSSVAVEMPSATRSDEALAANGGNGNNNGSGNASSGGHILLSASSSDKMHVLVASSSSAASADEQSPLEPPASRGPEPSHTVEDVMSNKNFVELRWNNLSYTVPVKGKDGKTTEKVLINSISGVARSGSVNALMGSSGAGKSTLLDLLAGRIKLSSRVGGLITVNGANRDTIKGIRNVVAYVMQNDALHPLLTVRETIQYSADLRLPMLSAEERRQRVDKVIEELGLQRVQDTPIGDDIHRGISGGEKRRVSIGVELVIQPKLLFLDEPTSGLDSSSAFDVVSAIHRLAKGESGTGKRCIILSIHQPNSKIFAMLDNVVFLSYGNVVYQGPVPKVSAFLEHVGEPVPDNTNPADHILDVVTERQKANTIEGLVETFQDWYAKNKHHHHHHHPEALKQEQPVVAAFDSKSGDAHVDIEKKVVSAIVRRDKINASTSRIEDQQMPSVLDDDPARVGWHTQVAVLLRVNFYNSMRTKELFIQRIMVNCFVSFIMGSLFYHPSGATEVSDYNSFIVFTTALINFTATEVMPIFLNNRSIFLREYANGYYHLTAYVMADLLTALPIAIAIGATYSFIGYWMAFLNRDAGNYFFFIYALSMMSLAANSFVVMVSTFVPNGIAGNSLATTLFAFMFLFSGFFIKRDDIPGYWIWFHYLSLFKYGFEALLRNQYDDNLNTLFECNRIALASNPACRLTPDNVRQDLDVDNVDKFGSVGCLIAFAIGFRFLMLLILKAKGTKRM